MGGPTVHDTRPNDLDKKIWKLLDKKIKYKDIASELGVTYQTVNHSATVRKRIEARKALEAKLCDKK